MRAERYTRPEYGRFFFFFGERHAFPRDSAKFYATILVDGFQVRRVFRGEVRKKKNLWDISYVDQVERKKNGAVASVVPRFAEL